MKEKELCYGMDFNKNDVLHLCHGCAKETLRRSPVRKNIDVEKADVFIAKRPLDKLHFDTCGPFEVLSREKYLGFVTVVDEVTRFRWILLVRSRAEIPEKIIELIEGLEHRHEGFKVKCLRSDQGTEFKNKRLETFARIEFYKNLAAFTLPSRIGNQNAALD